MPGVAHVLPGDPEVVITVRNDVGRANGPAGADAAGHNGIISTLGEGPGRAAAVSVTDGIAGIIKSAPSVEQKIFSRNFLDRRAFASWQKLMRDSRPLAGLTSLMGLPLLVV